MVLHLAFNFKILKMESQNIAQGVEREKYNTLKEKYDKSS